MTSHPGGTGGTLASTETMYVREYERGRVVRNVPIHGREVTDLLASLIGQDSDDRKRGGKVCFSGLFYCCC